jgi:hypothetical protein
MGADSDGTGQTSESFIVEYDATPAFVPYGGEFFKAHAFLANFAKNSIT